MINVIRQVLIVHVTIILTFNIACNSNEIQSWKEANVTLPFVDSLQVIGYDPSYDPYVMHVIGGNSRDNRKHDHYSINLKTGEYIIYPNILLKPSDSRSDIFTNFQGITINNIENINNVISS